MTEHVARGDVHVWAYAAWHAAVRHGTPACIEVGPALYTGLLRTLPPPGARSPQPSDPGTVFSALLLGVPLVRVCALAPRGWQVLDRRGAILAGGPGGQ